MTILPARQSPKDGGGVQDMEFITLVPLIYGMNIGNSELGSIHYKLSLLAVSLSSPLPLFLQCSCAKWSNERFYFF